MPDLGSNIGPFPIKNEQKLSKIVYIIPNFLVLQNFMKIRTKIPKLQMHENLHKMWMKTKHVFIHIFIQIFIRFYEGQSKQ